jgi:hypothetical protein
MGFIKDYYSLRNLMESGGEMSVTRLVHHLALVCVGEGIEWMSLHTAVPWLLSAASAWHLKMRMMHPGLEKQKHNLCYCSWHFVNV